MNEMHSGKKIASGMFWRFGAKITAQTVSFIVSIILARILMPEDYGIVAIANVFMTIAGVFVTCGFSTALVQKKEATQKDFSTIFWCDFVLSVGLYAIVYVCAPFLAEFYNIPLLAPVLRIIAIRLPADGINSIQNAYVSRHMDFKKTFLAAIIATVVSGAIGVGMACSGYGVWALVGQMVSNIIIETAVLFVIVSWKPTLEFSVNTAKPLIGFGWKVLVTDLIGSGFDQLNSFIIGKKYTSSDLAYYTQGKKIPELINNNLVSSLASVLFPAMSVCKGKDEIQELRRKSLKMLEYVLFPILMGMFVVADKMILILYTEKWAFAIPFVRIACIAALLGVFENTLILELLAIGKSDITLRLELIIKPFFLIIALVSMQFGVRVIALTMIADEVLACLFYVYPVTKIDGFDFKAHLLDAWPSFWMTSVMCVCVYGLGKVISSGLGCLVAQIFFGGVIYLCLSYFSGNESFAFLKETICEKIKKK